MDVLIVDDNETNVLLLKELLEQDGMHRIVTETDPRLVPGLLHSVHPDLVLLDLLMPHVDGLELLDEITRYAASSYLPVLVLTADTTTESRNRALGHGARDFLTKPFDTVEVSLRIANLLETRQLYTLLRHTAVCDSDVESRIAPDDQDPVLERIQTVFRHQSMVPFYQPVVDVGTLATVGHEALARFPDQHAQGPAGWFSDAFAVGLGTDLEWLAATNALPFLKTASPDTFLALNMSPASILLIQEQALCDPTLCPRIVIELTEHVPIEDYSAVHRALEEMRDHGTKLAADDLGSGYAGFRHLIALQPDIIKLDISLVRGIHQSRAQRALASALVAFAGDVAAQVIAEGVEEAAELAVLQDLGVCWAQGYYLGVPAPAG
jgi:EAL domain-containing protein (putative c-di-GMP-specific phosphodiesterase class I)/AmiR/NasT family two-component response regulator